jgi:hypothetical protein
MSRVFICDLESKGDPKLFDTFCANIKPDPRLKDPAKIDANLNSKIEEALFDMALDHDFCEIICVGVYDLHENKKHLFTPVEFAKWLNGFEKVSKKDQMGPSKTKRYQSYRMVGFNSRAFDLPILIKHGIRHGIDYPYEWMVNQLDKYKGTAHIDLMEKLSMVWGKNKSLDQYLQIYCGVAKTPIDFKEATEEEIKAHCSEDLDNTKLLFEKVNGKLFFNV